LNNSGAGQSRKSNRGVNSLKHDIYMSKIPRQKSPRTINTDKKMKDKGVKQVLSRGMNTTGRGKGKKEGEGRQIGWR
jgi:hypothetical protein